jgi:hypothetical protein
MLEEQWGRVSIVSKEHLLQHDPIFNHFPIGFVWENSHLYGNTPSRHLDFAHTTPFCSAAIANMLPLQLLYIVIPQHFLQLSSRHKHKTRKCIAAFC